jgi:hypothetical protein
MSISMPTNLYWGESFAHLLMAYSYIPHNLPPDSPSSPTYWPPLRKDVACSKAPLNLINNKHSGINQTLTHRKATRSNPLCNRVRALTCSQGVGHHMILRNVPVCHGKIYELPVSYRAEARSASRPKTRGMRPRRARDGWAGPPGAN